MGEFDRLLQDERDHVEFWDDCGHYGKSVRFLARRLQRSRMLEETYRNTLTSLQRRLHALAERGATAGPQQLDDLANLLADELDGEDG